MLPNIKFSKSNKYVILFGKFVYRDIKVDYNLTLIELIQKTSNPKDEGSCIRTNSNWICFSAIYYSEICGISFPVSLNDIDDIS